MKNLNLLLLLITLAMLTFTSLDSIAQEIRGNGNVIQETRNVGSFYKIEINGVVKVFLEQSDNESVRVEADANLIKLIKTKVTGNKLIIDTKEDVEIEKSTRMNVYVTFKNISKLEMNGVGDVESKNQLKLSNLVIENNAVGNLKLDLNCEKLNADINSVGTATFSGKVNSASIDHNGVGNVKAFDLSTNIMKIESNAVGNVEVNADGEIYIDNNGIGNISYKGNATVKSLNDNGVGKVKKL